jgi:hypothetical protein
MGFPRKLYKYLTPPPLKIIQKGEKESHHSHPSYIT